MLKSPTPAIDVSGVFSNIQKTQLRNTALDGRPCAIRWPVVMTWYCITVEAARKSSRSTGQPCHICQLVGQLPQCERICITRHQHGKVQIALWPGGALYLATESVHRYGIWKLSA